MARDGRYHDFNDAAWVVRHVDESLRAWTGSAPFVLGIGGPSGVGKSTLAESLTTTLNGFGRRVLRLGMDEFIRAPEERTTLGEWDARHVRLDELRNVMQAIRGGARQVPYRKYVRRRRRGVQSSVIDLDRVEIIVFDGLWALCDRPEVGALREFVDRAIYLSADRALFKRWRFQQESEKPGGRSAEAMERHWRDGIVPDTDRYIEPSRCNADLVLHLRSDHRFLILSGEQASRG